MIQVSNNFYNNQEQINRALRLFQKEFPNRKIININCYPNEPMGWFVSIVYEIEI